MYPQPTSSQVIIKRLAQLSLVCLVLCFFVSTVLITSTAQSPESATPDRKLKLKSFKDIPVALHKVRNLNSEIWHQDLEIEIKNISNKPIYYMRAYLVFPDTPVPPGGEAAIPLIYGDPKKHGRTDKYADPEDAHIAPGETYVFTVPELFKKGLKAKHEKFPEYTKNLVLRFAVINFGDGTGFIAGESRDYRGRKIMLAPPEKQRLKHATLSHAPAASTPLQDSCGGGNCFRWFIDPEPVQASCSCSLTRVATISLSEPCRRLRLDFIDCDGDGIPGECHNDVTDEEASASCPGAAPARGQVASFAECILTRRPIWHRRDSKF
jgi:hypothetical protein